MPIDPLAVITLGTFIQYSTPPAVSYQFLDGNGDPEDMSAGTWTGEIEGKQLHVADADQPTDIFENTPSVDDASATISYIFDPEDFDYVGRFRFTLYAGNGTNRLGVTYEYRVEASYNEEPTN